MTGYWPQPPPPASPFLGLLMEEGYAALAGEIGSQNEQVPSPEAFVAEVSRRIGEEACATLQDRARRRAEDDLVFYVARFLDLVDSSSEEGLRPQLSDQASARVVLSGFVGDDRLCGLDAAVEEVRRKLPLNGPYPFDWDDRVAEAVVEACGPTREPGQGRPRRPDSQTPIAFAGHRVVQRLLIDASGYLYLAKDADENDVTVRVFNTRKADGTTIDRLFERAARLERIEHRGLARVLEVGPTDQAPFLVLERPGGRSLAEILVETPPPASQLGVMKDLAEALAALHAAGAVHGDIHPGAVMVDPARGAVIWDYGIGNVSATSAISASGTQQRGVPCYLSPEHLYPPLLPASDVFSFGIVLYELLSSGRLPFAGRSVLDVLGFLNDPRPAAPRGAGVHAGVVRLCLACLARRPGDRPTAGQIAVALEDPDAVPQSFSGPGGGFWLRIGLLAGAAAAAALAAGLLSGCFLGANLREVSNRRVYRSAQPDPHGIERMKRRLDIRTVVNLRGADHGRRWYSEERRACKRLGIQLADIRMSATRYPKREEIVALLGTLDRARYPLLLHCRGGADRSGLASFVYLLAVEGRSFAEARRQLGLAYGHIPFFGTWPLDRFLQRFATWCRARRLEPTGSSFRSWVKDRGFLQGDT